MKPIVIKIHSFVDVITNSSTEIYINTDSKNIDTVKCLIEKLLKAADVNKTVDELFNVYILEDKGGYGYASNDLIIEPKNGDQETINLTDEVNDIFSIDGYYNG